MCIYLSPHWGELALEPHLRTCYGGNEEVIELLLTDESSDEDEPMVEK